MAGKPSTKKPFLDRADVAAIGGVAPKTVSQNLHRSKVGERYADDPFPTPDSGTGIGQRLWWLPTRRDEIAAWFKRHQEDKGGRPPKSAS
jgi:hypothetical protein